MKTRRKAGKAEGRGGVALCGACGWPEEDPRSAPAGHSAHAGHPAAVSRDTAASLEVELRGIEWEQAKLECDLIDPHPANRPVTIPECAELAESIASTGRLLERVKVRDVGGGRYQMLGGQRRLTAHAILGWPAIEAEVCQCSDAAARALVSLLNSHRKDLNPIEKARDIEGLCQPAEQGGAGMTREAAAAVHGLETGQSASNLLRLLELPAEVQDLVAEGKLPQSYARAVQPYLVAPPVAKWLPKEVANWGSDDRPARVDFLRDVQQEIRMQTKPMTALKFDKYTSDYDLRSRWADRLFEPSVAELEKLLVVEVPKPFADDKAKEKTEQRACNVKLWEKLQAAALPDALMRLEAFRKAKQENGKAKSNGKLAAAQLTPQQAAAQKRVQAKEAARKTAEAVEAWAKRFLRAELAACCRPGEAWIGPALLAVVAVAKRRRNQYATDAANHAQLLKAACQIQAARSGGGQDPDGPSTWAAVWGCVQDAREDERCAAEELQCLLLQLYLWPRVEGHPIDGVVAGDELPQCWRPLTGAQRRKYQPVELLEIPAADLIAMGGAFGVDLEAAWRRGAVDGRCSQRLIREFLELHTAEQLHQVANDLCTTSASVSVVKAAKTRADKVAELLNDHFCRGLRVPAAIKSLRGMGRKAK